MSRPKEAIIILAIATALGLFRYSDALFVDGKTATDGWGDGIGSIGLIQDIKDNIEDKGVWGFLSPTMISNGTGAGLAPPAMNTRFVNFKVWFLNLFVSPENAMDLYALVCFVLNAIAVFLFLRMLKIGFAAAFISAMLFNHFDFFTHRATGHVLSFLTLYAPLLALMATVWAVRKTDIKRMVVLALAFTLNFSINAYYGYFGLFACSVLFIAMTLFESGHHTFTKKSTYVAIGTGMVAFVVAMSIAFPDMIFMRFWHYLTGVSHTLPGEGGVDRNWGSFTHYAIAGGKQLAYLFQPSIGFLLNVFPQSWNNANLWEITYRVGLVVPALSAIAFAVVIAKTTQRRRLILWLLVWAVFTLCLVPFALRPDFKLSLVPLTFKVAPLLRVAVRALLYLDLGVIVMATILLDRAIRLGQQQLRQVSSERQMLWRSAGTIVLCLATFAAAADVYRHPLLKPLPTTKAPDPGAYKKLANYTRGLMLELPLHSPMHDTPEVVYRYLFYRAYHGMPIVNTPHRTHDTAGIQQKAAKRINRMSLRDLRLLQDCGVKYVAISKSMKNILRRVKGSGMLTAISEDEKVVIFQYKQERPVTTSVLKEFLSKPP